MSEAGSERLALFIDVENLQIEAEKAALVFRLEPLIERARESGILSFARGYADWTQPNMGRLVPHFQANAVQMDQLSTARGKNTADMQLALDALEMCLQAARPDVVMVVGGDRDFVPLVQKLKRYGIRVVGVGIEGSSSRCLANVCDEYLFYEYLVRPENGDGGTDIVDSGGHVQEHAPGNSPQVPSSLATAFNLLVRAINAAERTGYQAKGSNTNLLMRRLDPTFDPNVLGCSSFKGFVMEAQSQGYVDIEEHEGSDFVLVAKVEPRAQGFVPHVSVEPYSYGTEEEAIESYRRILFEVKRVPVVPWAQREFLVRSLWQYLSNSSNGLTINEMNDMLRETAEDKGFALPARALQKLTHTLNIGNLFARNGKAAYEPDMTWTRVTASTDIDTALDRMHATYLASILVYRPLSYMI